MSVPTALKLARISLGCSSACSNPNGWPQMARRRDSSSSWSMTCTYSSPFHCDRQDKGEDKRPLPECDHCEQRIKRKERLVWNGTIIAAPIERPSRQTGLWFDREWQFGPRAMVRVVSLPATRDKQEQSPFAAAPQRPEKTGRHRTGRERAVGALLHRTVLLC